MCIYELENECFVDKGLVVLRLEFVVLQVYQALSNGLVDKINSTNNCRIDGTSQRPMRVFGNVKGHDGNRNQDRHDQTIQNLEQGAMLIVIDTVYFVILKVKFLVGDEFISVLHLLSVIIKYGAPSQFQFIFLTLPLFDENCHPDAHSHGKCKSNTSDPFF